MTREDAISNTTAHALGTQTRFRRSYRCNNNCPSRFLPPSGHAPGHLRDAFCYLVEGGWSEFLQPTFDFEEETYEVKRLLGRLWNCTDILPGWACEELDIPRGSTYAKAVQFVLPWLKHQRLLLNEGRSHSRRTTCSRPQGDSPRSILIQSQRKIS